MLGCFYRAKRSAERALALAAHSARSRGAAVVTSESTSLRAISASRTRLR
jgi:hypothetical protein